MVEMINPIGLICAYLLDFMLGDPEWPLHPIRIIGKTVEYLEHIFRKIKKNILGEKVAGILLCAIVVISTYVITWSIIYLSYNVNVYFGISVTVLLAYTTLSIRSLGKAAQKVRNCLKDSDEDGARKKLSLIVGRDTIKLDRSEIIRATIETVAENTSDGIIAPIFYLILGGPPLGMVYKAVNTLDSMVGYKNERYLALGWASAKLDDIANYIPARITGILLIVAAVFLRKDWKRAYRTVKKDAKKHMSPNSGYPESAVAGALRLQLGGTNYYGGIPVRTALLGNKGGELSECNIGEVVSMMYLTSLLMILICVFVVGVMQ